MGNKTQLDSALSANKTRSSLVTLDSSLSLVSTREFWDWKQYNAPRTFSRDSNGNFYLGGVRDTFPVDSHWVYRGYLVG
ncbi:MAG: hypothetical protein U0176_19295 [Bacteroidia bacterium]